MSEITTVLKQLIVDKYGPAKFDVGCEMVAQWINSQTKLTYTGLFIKDICDGVITKEAIFPEVDDAIRMLFGVSLISPPIPNKKRLSDVRAKHHQ